MINGIRSTLGEGLVDHSGAGFPPETDYVFQQARIRPTDPVLPPLVFVHGAGGYIEESFAGNPTTVLLWRELAKYFTVIATDMGGDQWGNYIHQYYIERARLYLQNTMGCTGQVTLVGVSMGGAGVLNYTRNPAYSSNVRAVAGIIPLTSLNSIKAIFPASLNAAYGGDYTDATYGANHSPVVYGNASSFTNVPVKLFNSTGDTVTLPADQATFVAARPQTMTQVIGTAEHSDFLVGESIPSVVEFVRYLR